MLVRLADLGRAARRRWWLPVAAAVLCGIVAVALEAREPEAHRAEAVLSANPAHGERGSLRFVTDARAAIEDERTMALAARVYGGGADAGEVRGRTDLRWVADSSAFVITAGGSDPADATALAKALRDAALAAGLERSDPSGEPLVLALAEPEAEAVAVRPRTARALGLGMALGAIVGVALAAAAGSSARPAR
jgi:uncharacterized protein involved in exopolysaccharide biosynthesis